MFLCTHYYHGWRNFPGFTVDIRMSVQSGLFLCLFLQYKFTGAVDASVAHSLAIVVSFQLQSQGR